MSVYLALEPDELEVAVGDTLQRGTESYRITDLYHSGRTHRAQCEPLPPPRPKRTEFVTHPRVAAYLRKPPLWERMWQAELERLRRMRLQEKLDAEAPIPSKQRLRRNSIWRTTIDLRNVPGWREEFAAARAERLAANRPRVLRRNRRKAVSPS